MRWDMLEYVLLCAILAIIITMIILSHFKHKELKIIVKSEGDLVKDNLNHIAGAIVGLSELLDDADDIIKQVSQVPSMGEMMQQMIQGFIMSKMNNTIPNISNISDAFITPSLNEDIHGTEEVEK